jgi:hypothetical protein
MVSEMDRLLAPEEFPPEEEATMSFPRKLEKV